MQKGTICLKMQDEEPNLCKSYKRAPIYSVYILCAKINFRFKLAVNHISVTSSQLHHASFLRIVYGVHLTHRRAPGFVLIFLSVSWKMATAHQRARTTHLFLQSL